MNAKVGQLCINVINLERSIAFYEALGLKVTMRLEIPDAYEAILAGADSAMLQLAQQKNQSGPIDHGNALYKFYINSDDCAATFKAALAAGAKAQTEPQVLTEWQCTVAFIEDLDGYKVEIVGPLK